MVAPIASAGPSALFRLVASESEPFSSGHAPPPRFLDALSLPPERAAEESRFRRPEGADPFRFSGQGLRLLHVRAEITLERAAFDRTGRALGVESLSLSYERTELLVRRYLGSPAEAGGAEEEAAAPAPARFDPLQALREHFSPENTSNRILGFATAGFFSGRFSGGTGPDARGAFRDFILPFIEGAAREVLDAFGDLLPEEGRQDVQRTLDLIREGFQRFAEGGEAVATGGEAGRERRVA